MLRVALGCSIVVAIGCDRESGADRVEPRTSGIVSLSPAITTTLIDLGVGERITGRTPWCRGVDDRPVAGSLEGVDAELLVAIDPELVLHQPPATGTDPVLLGLQRRHGFRLEGGRLDGAGDVLELLETLESLEVVPSTRLAERRAALEGIVRAGAEAPAAGALRVLVLHSIDPVGVAGQDTYLGEIVAAAGLRNAAGAGGWRTWSIETLLSAEVDLILIFSGQGDGRDVATRLGSLDWPEVPRILVVPGADAFEPSTRMPEVLEAVRRELAVMDPRP